MKQLHRNINKSVIQIKDKDWIKHNSDINCKLVAILAIHFTPCNIAIGLVA